jgi:hypothetical protein
VPTDSLYFPDLKVDQHGVWSILSRSTRLGGVRKWFIATLRRPPRLAFHAILVLAGAILLWSFSYPGVSYFTALAVFWVLLIAVVAWLARLVGTLIAGGDAPLALRLAPFAVAPVGAMLVYGAIVVNIPLRVRWSMSRTAFERATHRAPGVVAKTEWVGFDVPERIGSYRILSAARVGDGIIFHEATGDLFDDAGFAYLPSGAFPEMENGTFESPQFEPLGDNWYAWTASW